MYIYSRHDQRLHSVKLLLDSGTSRNFVTAAVVDRYGLETEPCHSTVFKVIDGHTFSCEWQARVHWAVDSNENTRSARFYVLPMNADIEGPLVGEGFLEEFHEILLRQDPGVTNLADYTPNTYTTGRRTPSVRLDI
jgi:hypothetical protein